jgi:hypothetical protein
MMVDLYVTTQRRFCLEVHADEQPSSLPAAVTARIERVSGRLRGGMLHLATTEVKTDLPQGLQ